MDILIRQNSYSIKIIDNFSYKMYVQKDTR